MTGIERKNRANSSGFTLLEMLIVLGLFSVVLTAAVDIFLMANRAQRKTLLMELIQSDSRYAMESMVREIRSGAIDYPWYVENGEISENGYTETLAVIDGQGDRVRFFRSIEAEDCEESESDSCLMVQINGGDAQVITPRGVNIVKSSFYIRPNVSPFSFDGDTGLFGADVQPRVTISLVAENSSLDPRDKTVNYLQTTVGTRNFRR